MLDLSPLVRDYVVKRILADLRPSRAKVYGKTGAAVLLGGILSLLLCGQFGVGMTPLARHAQGQLQQSLSSTACILLCGAVFAAFPVLFLRLLSRAIEFRAIIRVSRRAPLVWLILLGGFLAYHGEHRLEILKLGAWALAAFVSFHLLAEAMDRIMSKNFWLAA